MDKREGNKDINFRIAEIFYEMADILEIKDVKWKPRAYILAGQTLESLSKNIEDIYVSGGIKALEDLPAIGEALANKIVEYIETGKISEHEKIKKSIPSGLYEIMRIPGVGAKKAKLFYQKLRIKNLDQLKKAVKSHELLNLRGFKEKSEQNILEGIELMKSQNEKMPLKKAEKIANSIILELKKIKEIQEAIAAGSLRRKKSSVRDIDIILLTKFPENALEKAVRLNFVKKVLGAGKEKATFIHEQGVQVDFRVFTKEEFGAGLLYFTGDKGHNIWLRKLAIKNGWKLNEYGLFDNKGKRIAGKTEKEIYDKLGLKFVSPEKRIGEVK